MSTTSRTLHICVGYICMFAVGLSAGIAIGTHSLTWPTAIFAGLDLGLAIILGRAAAEG